MSANLFALGAIVTAMLSVMCGSAYTAQVGSAEQGLRFSREACATCHLVVKAAGRSANSNAPTFAAIANTPGMTSAALRVALQTSHRTMPNFVIKDDDADSVIAYILTLKESK
jgi:mono/diheme cytochrome c family protein